MNNIDNIEFLKSNDIFIYDDFLNAKQCSKILNNINNINCWVKSKVAKEDKSLNYCEYTSLQRTCRIFPKYHYNIALTTQLHKITHHIKQLLNIELNKLEGWQLIKYEMGDWFNFHVDCGCWHNHPAGEREWTILIYLLAPTEGGETYFRALNQYILPIQGRLVVWNNLLPNGNCNYGLIHSGLRVKKGIKITLNTWIRQSWVINEV